MRSNRPGETHTLVVPEDVPDTITLFHVTGGYVYADPQGAALGYEDVFTKLESAETLPGKWPGRGLCDAPTFASAVS